MDSRDPCRAPPRDDRARRPLRKDAPRLAKNFVYQQQWNVNMLRCCVVKKTLTSRGSPLFHLPRNHRADLQIAFWCINGIFRVWLERV
jgi:hypothetical protein